LPNYLIDCELYNGKNAKIGWGLGVIVSNSRNKKTPPKGTIGFQRELEDQKREDHLNLLTEAEREVSQLFGILQRVSELIGHQDIAPVENIDKKLEEAYKKIHAYLNPKEGVEASEALGKKQQSGISLEKHPLLEEMGGMPLEQISPEWGELLSDEKSTLDKAEVENKLKNKLKQKHALMNKLQNELKLKSQPKFQPAVKKINELVYQYTEKLKERPVIRQALELELKEEPKFVPPKPAPF